MKKRVFSITTFALLAVLWALIPLHTLAQDPTEVDSDHYTVIFENEQVRVLRINYGPSEKSVMHYHPNGVAIFMNDANSQFTLPDGTVIDASSKSGDAVWAPAGKHLPENLSETGEVNVILVELKTHDEEEDE